jgi:C-terminal processing protease CtpA/Prc
MLELKFGCKNDAEIKSLYKLIERHQRLASERSEDAFMTSRMPLRAPSIRTPVLSPREADRFHSEIILLEGIGAVLQADDTSPSSALGPGGPAQIQVAQAEDKITGVAQVDARCRHHRLAYG